ncbi:hypothetical protein PEBR_02319 [Penicillium brasilianum]|uniref:Uncharacterized protein n=1 Tax=Penicillium brasilianum TaxID=104259 RepID=A0A1S9S0K9_PENBI|nr:hypothetical protein PEBR_02319 [Penicillium brasilianum]
MGRGLSEEEYRYCREPSEGMPLVEIINIFVEFTPLGADIESVDQFNQEACEKLLSACLAQKQSVLEWYARRKKTFGGGPLVLTDELLRCIDIEPVDVTFGKPYSFASLDDALLYVLYCMAMAMVSPMVARARSLVQSLRQGDQRVNDHTIDEEYSTMQIYADQIIRSVPFFVQEKHKLLGPHMVMFGVVTACKAYIKLGMFEKFDWCQKTLGSFGDRGFESCHNYRQDAWCHWNSGNSHTANPFRPISVRGDELMSVSPSLSSEDQPSDTSDCGKCPSSSCVEWKNIGKEAGSFMLEPSLLDDPWQEWAMCCVST